MTRVRRVPLLIAASVVAVLSVVYLLQTESAAPLAQQRAQTDLEFTRERARVSAAERRISALRQRLAGLQRAAVAQQGVSTANGEHVILGRDTGTPAASTATPRRPTAVRGSAQQAPRDGEQRIPQRLTHRNRLISASQAQALDNRLGAATQTARSLGERVNQPEFGAGLRALEQELERLEAEIASYD